jgi:hypothetical protein
MRLVVVHDQHGNLKGFATSPLDAPLLGIVTKPGEQMTEVELPDELRSLTYPSDQEILSNILDNYQVEVRTTLSRLVTKASST